MRNFVTRLFPAVVVLFLAGCGYHTIGAQSVPSVLSGKRVAIPVFVNKSYRANIEAVLTGSLIDEFALRTGGMVGPEETADLVLRGTVVSYTTFAVSYTAADTVREYRALITVEPVLAERGTGKVVWKGVLSWGQDYPASTNVALQQNSEEAAIREICRNLSQQIYQKISERF